MPHNCERLVHVSVSFWRTEAFLSLFPVTPAGDGLPLRGMTLPSRDGPEIQEEHALVRDVLQKLVSSAPSSTTARPETSTEVSPAIPKPASQEQRKNPSLPAGTPTRMVEFAIYDPGSRIPRLVKVAVKDTEAKQSELSSQLMLHHNATASPKLRAQPMIQASWATYRSVKSKSTMLGSTRRTSTRPLTPPEQLDDRIVTPSVDRLRSKVLRRLEEFNAANAASSGMVNAAPEAKKASPLRRETLPTDAKADRRSHVRGPPTVQKVQVAAYQEYNVEPVQFINQSIAEDETPIAANDDVGSAQHSSPRSEHSLVSRGSAVSSARHMVRTELKSKLELAKLRSDSASSSSYSTARTRPVTGRVSIFSGDDMLTARPDAPLTQRDPVGKQRRHSLLSTAPHEPMSRRHSGLTVEVPGGSQNVDEQPQQRLHRSASVRVMLRRSSGSDLMDQILRQGSRASPYSKSSVVSSSYSHIGHFHSPVMHARLSRNIDGPSAVSSPAGPQSLQAASNANIDLTPQRSSKQSPNSTVAVGGVNSDDDYAHFGDWASSPDRLDPITESSRRSRRRLQSSSRRTTRHTPTRDNKSTAQRRLNPIPGTLESSLPRDSLIRPPVTSSEVMKHSADVEPEWIKSSLGIGSGTWGYLLQEEENKFNQQIQHAIESQVSYKEQPPLPVGQRPMSPLWPRTTNPPTARLPTPDKLRGLHTRRPGPLERVASPHSALQRSGLMDTRRDASPSRPTSSANPSHGVSDSQHCPAQTPERQKSDATLRDTSRSTSPSARLGTNNTIVSVPVLHSPATPRVQILSLSQRSVSPHTKEAAKGSRLACCDGVPPEASTAPVLPPLATLRSRQDS